METNNLALTNTNIQDIVTKEKISEYLTAFNLTTLTPAEQLQFIEIAIAYQLNPFKREIYCVPYMKSVKDEQTGKWEKQRALSIITGYEVYLKRAERTGKLDGWKCESDDKGRAWATIYRKDWKNPFIHEVWLKEVGQFDDKGELRSLWKKMPKFMLKKVCIAQAFRLCFPDEFGGMPYIADEMPANMTDVNYIEPEKVKDKVEAEFNGQEITDEQTKFNLLSDEVKDGLKLTAWTKKQIQDKCRMYDFNNEKLMADIKMILNKEFSNREDSVFNER
jgi:phage recombination protein Bet